MTVSFGVDKYHAQHAVGKTYGYPSVFAVVKAVVEALQYRTLEYLCCINEIEAVLGDILPVFGLVPFRFHSLIVALFVATSNAQDNISNLMGKDLSIGSSEGVA